MGYYLKALIARSETLASATLHHEKAEIVQLDQGIAMIPLTNELLEEIDSNESKGEFCSLSPELESWAIEISNLGLVAYVEAEYFGGVGTKHAIGWSGGICTVKPIQGSAAINVILKLLGVGPGSSFDEFAAVGLNKHRHTNDWTMNNHELISFQSPDELAKAVASAWLDEIETSNEHNEQHTVALSGGRITQKFFAETVKQAEARKVDFSNVHFFWADERCLPPTDPESNFKLAKDLLFAPLKIAEKNIHRLRGEDAPDVAVQSANTEINGVISLKNFNLPVINLIFLGMGEDGHVASLFPVLSDQFLDIFVPFLVVKNSPKPPPTRISLSYKMIFAAKNLWILASGAGKEKVFNESLQPNGDTPMARVIQGRKSTKIFTDIPVVNKNYL